jgi:16S rRNA (uracil1498-N3)-methyltransferase
MTLVYCPTLTPDLALPDPEESHHLAHVLRKRPGDMVTVTDGLGHAWRGAIRTLGKRGGEIQLEEKLPAPDRVWPAIHIGIAPTKQSARLEWFLEKATETGVSRITMLETGRCERARWRHERLQRILIAAMKQSGRWHLPQLDPVAVLLADFVKEHQAIGASRMIATCEWGNLPSLSAVYTPGSEAVLLIGPEGDFTPEEVREARLAGFHPVLLGPHRLRTETAGVIACAQIMVLNEKS